MRLYIRQSLCCLLVGAIRAGTNAKANSLSDVGQLQHLRHRGLAETLQTRMDFYRSELFERVQMGKYYTDSKTFPDAVPRGCLRAIMAEFDEKKSDEGFDLRAFVTSHFDMPEVIVERGETDQPHSLELYMNSTWKSLRRNFQKPPAGSSLLPLPYDTIVPGGRFREWYYWDSFFPFTILRKRPEYHDLAMGMLRNVKYLVDQYGYIPNGNRDYYLGRSQPPVFSLMLEEVLDSGDNKTALEFLPTLKTAFQFWNKTISSKSPRLLADHGRTTFLKTGEQVFLYDSAAGDVPRPEAFREDRESKALTMKDGKDLNPRLYRDIQASCESGWDFASRFTRDCEPVRCLVTTEIAPIDLQILLHHKAKVLARLLTLDGQIEQAARYQDHADVIGRTIEKHFWDEERGVYTDIYWRTGEPTKHLTPAAAVPLVFGTASQERATRVLAAIKEHLLEAGGIMTSETDTHQQWDEPYGWAPLQYWVWKAALTYGDDELAKSIATRWVTLVRRVFDDTGRVYEKYDVRNLVPGDAGEYGIQTGFAFTNAVTTVFIDYLATA